MCWCQLTGTNWGTMADMMPRKPGMSMCTQRPLTKVCADVSDVYMHVQAKTPLFWLYKNMEFEYKDMPNSNTTSATQWDGVAVARQSFIYQPKDDIKQMLEIITLYLATLLYDHMQMHCTLKCVHTNQLFTWSAADRPKKWLQISCAPHCWTSLSPSQTQWPTCTSIVSSAC